MADFDGAFESRVEGTGVGVVRGRCVDISTGEFGRCLRLEVMGQMARWLFHGSIVMTPSAI